MLFHSNLLKNLSHYMCGPNNNYINTVTCSDDHKFCYLEVSLIGRFGPLQALEGWLTPSFLIQFTFSVEIVHLVYCYNVHLIFCKCHYLMFCMCSSICLCCSSPHFYGHGLLHRLQAQLRSLFCNAVHLMFCKHISSNNLSAPADVYMLKMLCPV